MICMQAVALSDDDTLAVDWRGVSQEILLPVHVVGHAVVTAHEPCNTT